MDRLRERLKRIEAGLRQATGRLCVGKNRLVLVWRAPERELEGGPGHAGVCATAGAGCCRAFSGVLDTGWAWHRHGLHGTMLGLSWGEQKVQDIGVVQQH